VNTWGQEGVHYNEMFLILKAIENNVVWRISRNMFSFFVPISCVTIDVHSTETFAIVSLVALKFRCKYYMPNTKIAIPLNLHTALSSQQVRILLAN